MRLEQTIPTANSHPFDSVKVAWVIGLDSDLENYEIPDPRPIECLRRFLPQNAHVALQPVRFHSRKTWWRTFGWRRWLGFSDGPECRAEEWRAFCTGQSRFKIELSQFLATETGDVEEKIQKITEYSVNCGFDLILIRRPKANWVGLLGTRSPLPVLVTEEAARSDDSVSADTLLLPVVDPEAEKARDTFVHAVELARSNAKRLLILYKPVDLSGKPDALPLPDGSPEVAFFAPLDLRKQDARLDRLAGWMRYAERQTVSTQIQIDASARKFSESVLDLCRSEKRIGLVVLDPRYLVSQPWDRSIEQISRKSTRPIWIAHLMTQKPLSQGTVNLIPQPSWSIGHAKEYSLN